MRPDQARPTTTMIILAKPLCAALLPALPPACRCARGCWRPLRLAGVSLRGFTVIELLIVMVIIAILVSMLLPIYGVMRREMMRSSTQMVESKVDGCLRLFKDEWGIYPVQASYADLSAGPFVNNLYYRIGTNIATSDRALVQQDAASAAQNFDYNLSGYNVEGAQPSLATYTIVMIPQDEPRCLVSNWGWGYHYDYAVLVNRMAREQASLAVLGGNLHQHGAVVTDNSENIIANASATPLLTGAVSATTPGWASDYLAGGLDQKFISGAAIIDAWRNPLIYICQAVPGVKGTSANIYGQPDTVDVHNVRIYGLGAHGFDATQGPGPGLATTRPWLLSTGRVLLSRTDAGDGKPTPTDPTYYPNQGNLLHSDVRYYAAQGYQEEFELWSGGADGFSYMRDDAKNADNVAILPYNKELANE